MTSDPLILAFDTSVAHCAAALASGSTLLGARTDAMARGQGEHLMGMLQEMLRDQGLGWSDIGLLAVGIGPGNFTGIRISVAAARGLALGLGVPVMGVSTFEIMRRADPGNAPGRQLISLRGPRGALYVQEFRDGRPDGGPRQITPGQEPAPPITDPPTAILGHDAADLARHLGYAPEAGNWQEAALPAYGPAIARIARARWRNGDTDPTPPAPLYVRAADAAPARNAPPVLLD